MLLISQAVGYLMSPAEPAGHQLSSEKLDTGTRTCPLDHPAHNLGLFTVLAAWGFDPRAQAMVIKPVADFVDSGNKNFVAHAHEP
jgi:hypothetical protein